LPGKAENGKMSLKSKVPSWLTRRAQQFRIHGLSRLLGGAKDLVRQWFKKGVKGHPPNFGRLSPSLELYVYPKTFWSACTLATYRRDANEAYIFMFWHSVYFARISLAMAIYHELAILAIPYVRRNNTRGFLKDLLVICNILNYARRETYCLSL